ncbi:MAG: DeoR family transcriptional regulator [Bacteroidetes bacterium]|nr:MAG: DeoR family transcriptional regulator [Bacteroidota bacterium]
MDKLRIGQLLSDSRLKREELQRCAQLCEDIPQKIKHFGLEGKRYKEELGRASILDCALQVSLDKESVRINNPDELFKFATRLEEKYGADIAQIKFFQDRFKGRTDFYQSLCDYHYLLQHFDQQELIMEWFESQSKTPAFDRPLHNYLLSLEDLLPQLNGEEMVLASILVHFLILNALPAEPHYSVLARTAQQFYLAMGKADAAGSIFLNSAWLNRQQQYKRIVDQLKFKDTQQFMESDLSGMLNFAIEAMLESLESANLRLRNLYQEKIEFDEFTPRQRNMVNYFFDEGFRLRMPKGKVQQNDRHVQIMEFIYEHHFASTKDLSLIYRLNRKTIQRDFNELMEMGLVRSMGNGAALRYTVPIRNNPYTGLERLQNINLGEQPVQISLFGSLDAFAESKVEKGEELA